MRDKSVPKTVTNALTRRPYRLGPAVQIAALALLAATCLYAVFVARIDRTNRETREVRARHQPLMDAIARGDVPRVWRMLDDGESANSVVCSPSSPSTLVEGDCESALTRAARFGQAGMVRLLIERGADVAARGVGGMTARDVAQRLARGCGGAEGDTRTDRCRRYEEVLRVLKKAESSGATRPE
jgi:hypothetical protein